MCGRYTLRKPATEIAEEFDLPEVPVLMPRFNVAPTQNVAVVRLEPDQRVRGLDTLRWGLIPSWADDPSIGNRMINARAETVAEKPAFRHALKAKRCLVVADGFFEWQKIDGRKQPFYIKMRDDHPFAFAGLWERWTRGDVPIESCTIITTGANELMQPIHDRMPVVIPKSAYDIWLDLTIKDHERLQPLLAPYPSDEMVAYTVSTLVNSPKNDVEACVQRVG
jgi:putative SOS response-associated peptidase YedK